MGSRFLTGLMATSQLVSASAIRSADASSEEFQNQFAGKTFVEKTLHKTFPQWNVERLLKAWKSAKERKTHQQWKRFVNLFWEEDWPKETQHYFAEAFFFVIQTAPRLKDRRASVDLLSKRSEWIRQYILLRYGDQLMPKERLLVQNPILKTIDFDSVLYESDVIRVDGELMRTRKVTVGKGVYRWTLISNVTGQLVFIGGAEEVVSFFRNQAPLAKNHCLAPHWSSRIYNLRQIDQVFFSKNCVLRKRQGRWTQKESSSLSKALPTDRQQNPKSIWRWLPTLGIFLLFI